MILQPMQSGIERTLFHLQNILRGPLNHFSDSVPVCVSGEEGTLNHHVQRALQHLSV